MNKQLIQDIIKAANKAIDSSSIKYTVETEYMTYYSYNELYYDDDYIEFEDDYDDEVVLSYEDIIGIRLGNI